jgi:DNA invertase Pin-like site-specific DNA recombinase
MSTPAVSYLRASTDKQEHSVTDQRAEVARYAAEHGFRIVHEYVDEGISGDATEKRADFRRMLADAARGDFRAVLCWDQDRFGRFDPLEAGYWVKPLRDAGVWLETVAQGRINWDDFAGRIVYSVQQEAKHAFLRDLSRNVLRGMVRSAAEGRWNGGRAPYAYDVRDGRLLPGDPARVEVVRWIFPAYAAGELGLRGIVKALNARGVPSPHGRHWRPKAVWEILTRTLYTGDMVWNRRHGGKYHGVEKGAVTPGKRRAGVIAYNADEDLVVKRDTHEALVDRDTFDRAARRLASNERGRPRNRNNHFALCGLVYCGHCGAAMYGCSFAHARRTYHRLVCSTYHAQGRSLCEGGRVEEAPLVRAVVGKLQQDFLEPANLAKLRAELLRQAKARSSGDPEQARRLRAQLAELGRTIDRGAERLLAETDDSLLPLLRGKLQEWQRQREELQGRLDALEQARQQGQDGAALAERAVGVLWRLRDRLDDADPRRLGAVLREVVARADVWFDSAPYGANRTRRLFRRCVVQVRPDAELVRKEPIGLPMETLARTLDWLLPQRAHVL